jgi:hypothetical protein
VRWRRKKEVEVRRSSDLEPASGSRGAVIGVYRQVDVRQNAEGPPRHEGHAAVQLEDGIDVFLEPTWSDDALRPAEEIARCDGRQVRAVGTVWSSAPEPPEPVAAIVSPCLHPVEAVDVIGSAAE